ncbi:CDGSH iron-sulfur domain-containing protein 2 homolog [Diorhabda carinulata]|uniref:CDGSH iron-sulfur domain-containing protein 2 homolog n=1 Tax=Diorhabda sublineata TaxID=1163346 RepID=UPI0024E0D5CE|nr:CDGSH iron-sulfur domain-containing protein 2 homolog [Diorhabda sublineata]XP_057670072.1 CDGSH iron-sulfur domain-containing protein 2 homolog [Diorhabda carinulata]
MQPFAYIFKEALPVYLTNLPIPDSLGGWFRLGFKDFLALVPPTAAVAGLTYMSYLAFCPKGRCGAGSCDQKGNLVNPSILKKSDKVVDSVDVEDIAEKAVFCRCWRSKNWPYCDGSHNGHNKREGDNVGPLIISKK